MHGLRENTNSILVKGLKLPLSLVSKEDPGTNPPWIPMDNCIGSQTTHVLL